MLSEKPQRGTINTHRNAEQLKEKLLGTYGKPAYSLACSNAIALANADRWTLARCRIEPLMAVADAFVTFLVG